MLHRRITSAKNHSIIYFQFSQDHLWLVLNDWHLELDVLSLHRALVDVDTLFLSAELIYCQSLFSSRDGDCAYSLNNHSSNLVWVTVASGPSVLEVALALLGALPVDTNTGATVGNSPSELVVGSSLVRTSHPCLVTLTVDLHVLLVAGRELLHSCLNGLHSTIFTHLGGRDVGVQTSTVPVAGDWLWCEGDLGAELFGDTVEDKSGHPKLVAHYRSCQYIGHCCLEGVVLTYS